MNDYFYSLETSLSVAAVEQLREGTLLGNQNAVFISCLQRSIEDENNQ